jgi:DNA repair protein RadC
LKIYESNEKLPSIHQPRQDNILRPFKRVKDKERFMVAFLDSGNNVIETKTMSEGSIGQTAVYPREILKYALAVIAMRSSWP